MEKNNKQFKKPHIGMFVSFLCEEYKLDPKEVGAKLLRQFPELKNKEKCANCDASMAMYIYKLDSLDALLLFGMGKIVHEKLKNGATFKEANSVHLQTKLNTYYSVPSRSTQCSKLGLITKVKREDGSHDQKAGWLITRRGFEFLAGKRVPKQVQVFRNEITERYDETITFQEAMQSGKRGMEHIELRKYAEYDFSVLESWSISGYSQGRLL